MQKIFGTDEMRYCGVDDVHIAAAELIERLEKEESGSDKHDKRILPALQKR